MPIDSILIIPASASFSGQSGNGRQQLSVLGCADILGNGSTQMVMEQSDGSIWLTATMAGATRSTEPSRGGRQQLSRRRLRPIRHIGARRDADAGCRRRIRGLSVQRNPERLCGQLDGCGWCAVGGRWHCRRSAEAAPAPRPRNSSKRWRRWEAARLSAPRVVPRSVQSRRNRPLSRRRTSPDLN